MTVTLLPPITSSGTWPGWDGKTMPLYEAPRYVRGKGNSRWHRPRSGTVRPTGQTIVHFWCGPGLHDLREAIGADTVPGPDPVCGTCVGRALGAGQDDTPDALPRLTFEPRWIVPPSTCPGSGRQRMFEAVDRIGRCLPCGLLLPVRATGSPYCPDYGVVRHTPGPDLIDPCPWHAWNHITVRRDQTVGCACGWSLP